MEQAEASAVEASAELCMVLGLGFRDMLGIGLESLGCKICGFGLGV